MKERVIEARQSTDLSQAEFARRCGVSPAAMSQIERGLTLKLKADTASEIERLTGYSSRWLATGRGAKLALGKDELIDEILSGLENLPDEKRQAVLAQFQGILTLAKPGD